MRKRPSTATAIACIALFFSLGGVGLAASGHGEAARAHTAASSSCRALVHGFGAVLGIAASGFKDSGQYLPLIEQAAKAGLDNSRPEIDAVVSKEKATLAKINGLTNQMNSLAPQVLAVEQSCLASSH